MLGLSACQTTPPLEELPEGVTVGIHQNRDDYGPRRLEISVSNDGDTDLTVTRATFESSGFASGSSTGRRSEIPSGVTRDLKVTLGDTVCAPQPVDTTLVRVEFRMPDGRRGAATVTPADEFGAIARVHAQDCLEETTLAIVDIEPSDTLRVVDVDGVPTAQLDIAITPSTASDGGETVTVESIGRTVLIRPPANDAWSVGTTFSATSGPAVVTLDILPNNCNTHTVAEDKRGTFFPVNVSTGDGTAGTFYVGVTDAVRGQIYDYIAHDFCNWS